MVIVDDQSIVGSANIADEYASYKYGMNMFLDINAFSENLITSQLRHYFKTVADYYGIQIHPKMSNEQVVAEYNAAFPSMEHSNYQIISSNYYSKKERKIQDFIINLIDNAQESIVMV